LRLTNRICGVQLSGNFFETPWHYTGKTWNHRSARCVCVCVCCVHLAVIALTEHPKLETTDRHILTHDMSCAAHCQFGARLWFCAKNCSTGRRWTSQSPGTVSRIKFLGHALTAERGQIWLKPRKIDTLQLTRSSDMSADAQVRSSSGTVSRNKVRPWPCSGRCHRQATRSEMV